MNPYSGSNFDDFLAEEGILAEVSARALKRLPAMQMKALVVIPTQAELDCFLQGCTELGFTVEAEMIGRIPAMSLPSLGLAVANGGLGKVQFAVQTQHLLDSEGWDVMICAGAAGALDDRLSVGDVVIGSETVEYDIRNKFGKPRLPRFTSDAAVVEEFRGVAAAGNGCRLHFGPIASGDEDVVDAERRRDVRELTAALATAWEGAGAARACSFSGVSFVEIRGISDGADHAAAQDFEKNLPGVMRAVARVITEWASYRARPSEETTDGRIRFADQD
jgi:adenosylhomocysteine nucleosidase